MRFETRLLHFDAAPGDPYAPVSTPIYQTATFAQESAVELGAYDYSRSGNPTRTVLESQLARLEGAERAFAFASGMAAVRAVLSLVPAGGHVVAGDDLYGGTCRLLSTLVRSQGISVSYADPADLDAFSDALRTDTSLVLIETPSNPLLRVADLRALAARTHAVGARLAVDGSLLPPCLQTPLALGADLVVHSATKFLSGHSDLTGGVVAVADETLAREIAFLQNAEGTALSPFESWLLLRGLKTLALRTERQQANAERVARFLAAHPLVRRVHYPGLPGHTGAALNTRQARGAGSVLSFETGDPELSRRVAEGTRLFTIAVSFGSVGSTVSLPCRMSHASIPAALRAERRLPEDLVRLSVGIEDADDLLEDLEAGFRRARPAAADQGEVFAFPASSALLGGAHPSG